TCAIDGNERTMWIFEPHVAENVLEDWLKEHNIQIHRDEWLDREKGIKVKNGEFLSIMTLSGKVYTGEMFIDATYEGDLMAAAGVSYHVGRESNDTYDEEWDGVQVGTLNHPHWFQSDKCALTLPCDTLR